VDIANNDLDAINANNDIGYPGYSRLDDKLLFNTLNGKEQNVSYIGIDKNKISPVGTVKELFTDASWAVWYAQGARAIPTKADQTINFAGISDKNIGESFNISATSTSNLSVQFTVDGGDITINGNRVTVGNTAGKAKIKAFQLGNSQFNAISLTQTFCIIPTAPRIATSGNNLVASGGSNFQWYINGNTVGGQTTSTSIAADLGGTYTVRAITNDGCQSLASNSIAVAAKVLGTELDESIKVGIYPNPTADELRIELPAGISFKGAKFYSVSGSNVMSFDKLSSNNSLNISQLAKGMYSIKIETSRGSVARKIVRE
jgi:bacillolysin